MTYELAKQLKDAGFPVRSHSFDGDEWCMNCGKSDDTDFCLPTLSELIAACGDGNFKLIRTRNGELWSCEMRNESGEYLGVSLNHPTAEEAVGKLWLALKEK